VIIGNGNTRGIDNEARPAPGAVQNQAHFRIDEGALGFHLDDGFLYILQ